MRKDWKAHDETFSSPLQDEFKEDFEDCFQEVTKETVFHVKDNTPHNPYDRSGHLLH